MRLLVHSIALYGAALVLSSSVFAQGSVGPPAVGVITAEYKPIAETTEINGRIQSRDRVDLVARVTAFLDERLFVEGAEVKKGDMLYRLEQPPFQADVEAKQAAVAQAEAQHTATPKPNKDSRVVDQTLLARLKKLLRDSGAKVVLSSTWRHERDGMASARELGIPFMDVLPDMRPHARNEEIVAWLEAHPDVQRFAVIDDDDDSLDSLPLFQPSAAAGLTDKLARAAADYLNGKTDKDMRRNAIVRTFQKAIAYLKGHNG